jgi:hypothetical protein
MWLSSDDLRKVKSGFQTIKTSIQGLLDSTDFDVMLPEVKDDDRRAFRSEFREAQRLILSAFNGEDDNGKLKYHGWGWYGKAWTDAMKHLQYGINVLGNLIKLRNYSLEVDEDLEGFITQCETCKGHMTTYKEIWAEIIPEQLRLEEEWSKGRISKYFPNPYRDKPINAKLDALKALI